MNHRDLPLHVLNVVAPAPTGGLESVVLQTSVGLAAKGHHVRVAAVMQPGTDQGHPFLDSLRDAAIPVDIIEVGTRAYREERRAVSQLAWHHDAQILHTHGYRPDVVDGPLARALGCAHVTTQHGFIGGSVRGRVYEWLQIRAAKNANAAIAVSTSIFDRLSRAGAGGHTHLVRNAIIPGKQQVDRATSRIALSIPLNETVVGWVGRLSYEKGPDVFIEAMAQLPEQVHGVFIGDGPIRESLHSLSTDRGIAGRIHFAGMIANASRYFSAFDVLAMTSRTEGTPMVLLEAMWGKVPIVATGVGGIPDLVGETGAILCPTENHIALANAIAQLINTTQTANELADRAYERVSEHFDPDIWISKYENIYQNVVKK